MLSVDLVGRYRLNPEAIGKMYFHRSGAAFVRMAPCGVVLMENVHWRSTGGEVGGV